MNTIELNYQPTNVQKRFHRCNCDEVLFGGAAGGGKSFAIVMDAIDRCLRQDNICVYIFRRTYKELNDSIINTARQMVPSCLAKYNASRHELNFINKSCIKFRHMQRESDKYRYQGAEINVLYIDELTHFSKAEYDFLKSRLRANKSKKIVPIVRCTSNPGGLGHAWVKSYFIDGCAPEEIFYEKVESSLLGKSRINQRIYIPAKVTDNPHINDEYIFELEKKPKALKDALLHGRWDAFEGQVFSEWRDVPEFYKTRKNTHVIEPFKIPDHFPKFRSFDFGYSRPFSVLWWAVGEDDEVYLYKEWYGATSPNVGLKISPAQIAQGILERDGDDEIECSYADPSIWDSSRGESVALQMEREGVFFLPGENARLSGKMAVHERLKIDENGKCGMQVFKTCREFIRAIPAICYSSINPEDVNTDGEDHSYDAMRYFLMNRIHGKKNPIKSRKVFNPLEENERFIDDFRGVNGGRMTEKQRLFCVYYAQTLNQRKAARMAGYKSDKYGWDLIQNPEIRAKIKAIKEDMNECNLINSWDILRMYIKIGFADIEEFIDIGTDENGENFINFKDEFDGQIVDEIQIRKGEPKIKLADRMKALEKLEKYFDLMGYEGLKKKIMEKKIDMEKPVTNINVVTGIERFKEEEN